MKKTGVLILCAAVFVLGTIISYGKNNSVEEQAASLLTSRIEILNQFYRQGLSAEEAEEQLARIESDSLLATDRAAMKKYEDTDIDRVTNYSIKITDFKKSSHRIFSGKASILWEMEGLEENYCEKGNYFFTAEQFYDKIKITQFVLK